MWQPFYKWLHGYTISRHDDNEHAACLLSAAEIYPPAPGCNQRVPRRAQRCAALITDRLHCTGMHRDEKLRDLIEASSGRPSLQQSSIIVCCSL